MKKLKNVSNSEGLLKIAWKVLKFWRKSTGIYRNMHAYQDLMNDFDWARKTKQNLKNSARLDQKWRDFWKFPRKFWDFLIKISVENWLFSQISYICIV